MRKFILIALIFLCCAKGICYAQSGQPDINFGSVKAEDFSSSVYAVDSNAEAIYLFDVGSAYYHEDGNAHFELVYQRHYRVRILNQNAFDFATLKLSLDNTDDSKETLTSLNAAVYNLKDGKVVAEQIDSKSVFTEKDKQESHVKLTLPKVIVGSIVEFSYIISRPPTDLPEWSFQGRYPRLWSRYEVVIPYLFNFAILKQGNLSFVVDSVSTFHNDYSYGGYGVNERNTLQHTWVMKNVPAIVQEPFIGTIDNYTAKIEFQLSAYTNMYNVYREYNQTWANVCNKLMASPVFGLTEEKEKKLLGEILKTVCGQDSLPIDKAKHIYRYVRDNYTCIYHYGKLRSKEMKELIQSKKGTLSDINLLLCSLLEEAGLTVTPILLSTTDHGKIVYEYPTLSRYNYVICQLIVDKKQYLLDAGYRYMPFGSLNDRCYNGYSHTVKINGSQGTFISPNSLVDSIATSISISRGDNEARVTTSFGTQPSIELKSYNEDRENKNPEDALKFMLANEATVTDVKVKGIADADSNVVYTYRMPLESMNEELVYFSPLLSLQMKSNPFNAATRTYGIEMPFCRKDIYHVNMEIPDGYKVEEMPKPDSIKADDILSNFSYAIREENNILKIDIQATTGRSVYLPEDYNSLRKFYSEVLAKESQQIIFKKKS